MSARADRLAELNRPEVIRSQLVAAAGLCDVLELQRQLFTAMERAPPQSNDDWKRILQVFHDEYLFLKQILMVNKLALTNWQKKNDYVDHTALMYRQRFARDALRLDSAMLPTPAMPALSMSADSKNSTTVAAAAAASHGFPTPFFPGFQWIPKCPVAGFPATAEHFWNA